MLRHPPQFKELCLIWKCHRKISLQIPHTEVIVVTELWVVYCDIQRHNPVPDRLLNGEEMKLDTLNVELEAVDLDP